MTNQQAGEGSTSRDLSTGSSESTLQLNIKTLDSRIYSFDIDKNVVVSAFKEKIAGKIGIPVMQQRLIFRGKVLKDDHPLSEYNVENGDTLHVVERQPQPPPGSNTVPLAVGHDSASGGQRHRIGQIAHSVVLGTLNVGEPGGGVAPDLSQVIGAVLNSVGLGNLAGGVQPGVPASQRNGTEESRPNAGSQNQVGNQPVPLQGVHGQSGYPMGSTFAIPSLNMPIPDALTTITGFMNQMELALSQNGNQQNQPSIANRSSPTPELPRNTLGYPTVEALNIVLQHAQRLLRDTAVPALSNVANHLDQERGSSDSSVREQVQTESMRLGVAMQHLGALLLELGRTILTLRLGQSPDESFVNAGPAVYISPSGPNLIMVQPFPLQNSSLFGNSSGVAPSSVAMGTIGVGNVARNVNIHIHTGASLAPLISTAANRTNNGEEGRGERVNGTDSGESGQARISSRINTTASTVPPRSVIVSHSSNVQPSASVSQASDPDVFSSILAQIGQSRIPVNRRSENDAPSDGPVHQDQPGGGSREVDVNLQQRDLPPSRAGEINPNLPNTVIMDVQKGKTETSTSSQGDPHNASIMSGNAESDKVQTGSSHGTDNLNESSGMPLGLGLGGLQPKRRSRNATTHNKISGGASSNNQDKNSLAVGQQVLQSLASLSTRGNLNPPSSQETSDLSCGVTGSAPESRQNSEFDEHNDVEDAMSQVLSSPSLDGVLAGVSQQTGIGSPDIFRNMLQQITQNPAMRSTLNQMAQQMDGDNLGSMFSGRGGGFDLSGMMQQMMPIVSQALGGASSVSHRNRPSESVPFGNNSSRRDAPPINDDPQVVMLRPEVQTSPHEMFRSVAGRALDLFNGGNENEHILNELCSQTGLAQEFMEMLRSDMSQKLQNETGS